MGCDRPGLSGLPGLGQYLALVCVQNSAQGRANTDLLPREKYETDSPGSLSDGGPGAASRHPGRPGP